MKSIPLSDILELSVPERILLVEDIWDSIHLFPDAIELTDDQKKDLDQRLDAYHKNPEVGSPWNEVRARIESKV